MAIKNCNVKRHKDCVHIEDVIEESVERMMRERHKCDNCGFKSISKDVLEKHRKIMHEKKKGPVAKEIKRRKCDACQKRFNKEETFKKHMQTVHGAAETSRETNYRARYNGEQEEFKEQLAH